MNHFPRHKIFAATIRCFCVLLVVTAWPVSAPAQPKSASRWLFIFDLSPAMKKRLPATEAVLKNFFATSAEGRLQAGDEIGVWTYDQKMRAGQFPLVTWKPDQATALTTNLIDFLRAQKFAGNSQLATVQPALASVISDSERLTIIIFCDGDGDITTTPYASGINQNFLDGRAERRKNQQPFVVLIRTLSGKPIGCTVNYPPGAINIPLFLAPPAPTNAPPHRTVSHPVPPPVAVPDLVIVGTKVGTAAKTLPETASPVTKPTAVEPAKMVATNSAPASAPLEAAATNFNQPALISAPASQSPQPKPVNQVSNVIAAANPVATKTNATSAPAKVNPPALPVENQPDRRITVLIMAGGGLLTIGVVLVVVWLVRSGRQPRSSLITSSMQDDRRRK